MCDICIFFGDRDFEHDVFELVRAFYPGKKLRSIYEKPEENCGDLLFLEVSKEENSYVFRYRTPDREGDRRAALKGQFSEKDEDALISCPAGTDSLLSAKGCQEYRVKDRRTPESHRLRKQNKDALKSVLYQLLRELTGKDLPWGNLTGIRPAKLAMGLLDEGMTKEQVIASMEEQYFVSRKKTALAVSIACREKEILKEIDYASGYSLYIGIPFCPSICLYCSFSSCPIGLWKNRVEDYLEALFLEIRETAKIMADDGRRLQTVYIGGGTPTTLSPSQLYRLLFEITESFPFGDVLEFTVEAGRPDSITKDKLLAIKAHPVTRISVNPQTMNQKTLDIIGRRHTVLQTEEAFNLARETGFDNINMDLIVGLPGEGLMEVQETLGRIRALSLDSLTIHSLALKRASRLNTDWERYRELSFENSQEIMDAAMETAAQLDMSPYYLYRQKNMKGNFENVGCAKDSKAGIYNILIMEEKQPIIALGAGGSSKLVMRGADRIERVENVKDVAAYISRIQEMIERKRQGITMFLREKQTYGKGSY